MTADHHHPASAPADDLQAAIAVNHLISDESMTPEQIIERLGDVALQIQLGVQQLWERVTPPSSVTPWLSLTQIEELTFWRPKPEQAGIAGRTHECLVFERYG